MKNLKTFEKFFDLNDDFAKVKYEIIYKDQQPVAIKCLTCDMTSYNANDIKYKYCGNCHVFHDDTIEENHYNDWRDSDTLKNTNDVTGIFDEEMIILDTDNVNDMIEMDYVITPEDNEALNTLLSDGWGNVHYEGEDKFNVIGRTVRDAAIFLAGDNQFTDEWAVRILVSLFPEKYEHNF